MLLKKLEGKSSMKKVAFIVDADNWAFANIAKNIKKNLKNIYDIQIFPIMYFDEDLARLLIETEDFDLIHFLWRGLLLDINTNEFLKSTNSFQYTRTDFLEKYLNHKIITTGIYDHLFTKGYTLDMTEFMTNMCNLYYTSSNRLKAIYDKLPITKKPYMVITDGVDLNDFYPINLERFENVDSRPLVIGWVGNSAWEKDKGDQKGVNTILKPAIKELQKEGFNIEMYFADRQERMIPHDQMVNYYSKIDLYVCTSESEGTPNPVLESMATGVPVISTDVGIVPDAFGPKQKQYIMKKRSKEELKRLIKEVYHNKKILHELSIENLEYIKKWSWKEISYNMKTFLDKAFENAKD